jgi:hypothetical protein
MLSQYKCFIDFALYAAELPKNMKGNPNPTVDCPYAAAVVHL